MLDRPLAGAVCDACWRAVVRITPPLCGICGDALPGGETRPDVVTCARCSAIPPHFAVARSAGRYDGVFRNVIHAFKYGGRRPLARAIARLMVEAGAEVLSGADAVVPVPLHPWRAFRRGFNQADDLAVHLGLPVWRVLRRRRHGPPQAAQSASERESNVRSAFARRATFGWSTPWWSGRLHGRTLVLVDDVMTTGATLEACSAVLLAAGVRSVRALTAARAVSARPVRPRDRHHRATAPH